ncbi:MAG: DUF2786 domain-containing protein [Verrucomicrobia bacterium]|nr:DUF2786 domain-containing protein [Verrucomicrobiota bacterium]MBS0636933.1 DUF2786 domain-containing protein [Verrucomicrobiota bacterium]
MIIYSEKIIRFIAEIKRTLKIILTQEVGLKVHGERFYNKSGTVSYPIKIVIYNTKAMLGYFASDFYELGFHERLMHVPKKQLHDIIRHELAHYLAFIEYGAGIMPHGLEFKTICHRLRWDDEVQAATTCLDDGQLEQEVEDNAVLRKVEKLMALAASSNPHEAELALIKSRELLLKHSIDSANIGDNEEKMYLIRVLKQKKESAKMRAIAKILDTFFVSCIFSRASGWIYLELVGTKSAIEIAEYVANFLDRELEELWEQARKENDLSGMIAKNSFFLGIAKGYCKKIQALQQCHSQALIAIEKKLVTMQALVYPRLRQSRSSASFCPTSSKLGELIGKNLTINRAVEAVQTQLRLT